MMQRRVMSVKFFFRSTIIFSLLLSACLTLSAQDVKVKGEFFADSLMIGDETRFALIAKYPSNVNLLFPDSTFNFAPFEFYRKEYFPTKSSDGSSYDSVIYYLSTFEIDRVQSLSLPVFQLNPRDCTAYQSNRDTILLTSLVGEIPDTVSIDKLPLKVNIAYQNISWLFNYPILIGVVVALMIIGIGVWLGFGKKIRKHYRLKRMLKAHQKFLEVYSHQVSHVKTLFSPVNTESAMGHWKKYMEQLEGKPYTKLTTRETARLEKDELLKKNLQAIDGAIYGHNTTVIESLEKLKEFADQRFTRKLEEVKHG
jgi:hypothetical protein